MDDARNAIDCHLDVIDGLALETPSFNDDGLATSDVSVRDADSFDHGVSLDLPAVVASEVAMSGSLARKGVADAEAHFWHLLTWVLVTDAHSQGVNFILL